MPLTQTQIQTVLRVLESGKSLRKACEQADLSNHARWFEEMARDPSLADQYSRAREIGYQVLSEDLVDSLDDSNTDPARLRIQTDTRKWMLSKMLPKIYGDRLDLNHSGKISSEHTLTTSELMAIAAKGKGGES